MSRTEGHETSPLVVPAQRVRESGQRVTVRVPGQEVPAGPRLEILREGAIIRALDITCSCGACIRVVCDYDEPAQG